MIKESEISELLASLNGSRMAQLLVCWQAELSIQQEAAINQTDPTNVKVVVKMTKKEINSFSSKIIHSQMKTMLLGNNIHVMTQSLKGGDGLQLPHSLSVNLYTKVISGSK